MLQQAKAAADVDRVAGDGDLGAIGNLGQRFMLDGVQAQVRQNAGLDTDEFEALAPDGIGQVVAVLVVVQVNVASIEGDVGRCPVRELDDLDVQLLLKERRNARMDI